MPRLSVTDTGHRAGTGSSHTNPIAIPSSPVSPQDSGGDAKDFPNIDDIQPQPDVIDLTTTENVPFIVLRNAEDEGEYSDWSGIDSEDEDEHTGADIPNPPEGFLSATIQDLQAAVNIWAKDHGFAVVRKNGRNKEKRGQRQGSYTRYELRCDRSGLPESTSTGLRKFSSRKCNCMWRGYAVLSEAGWLYRNYSDNVHHNHDPSPHASAHPQHRKRSTPVLDTIAKVSRHPGVRAREVGSIVADEHPESVLVDKDIYNIRAKLKRDELGGRTATGALKALFDKEKIPYKIKWVDDREEELVGLVFTFPDLMKMTEQFWEVTAADMTYRTNIFNYPLFQVTSLTSCNSIFNSFFGFIDNKRREYSLQSQKSGPRRAPPPTNWW